MSHLQYLRPFNDMSSMAESPHNDSTTTANTILKITKGSPFGSPSTASHSSKRVSFLTHTNKTSKAATNDDKAESSFTPNTSSNPLDASTFMMDLDDDDDDDNDDYNDGGLSTTQSLYTELSSFQNLSGVVPSKNTHQLYKLFERTW